MAQNKALPISSQPSSQQRHSSSSLHHRGTLASLMHLVKGIIPAKFGLEKLLPESDNWEVEEQLNRYIDGLLEENGDSSEDCPEAQKGMSNGIAGRAVVANPEQQHLEAASTLQQHSAMAVGSLQKHSATIDHTLQKLSTASIQLHHFSNSVLTEQHSAIKNTNPHNFRAAVNVPKQKSPPAGVQQHKQQQKSATESGIQQPARATANMQCQKSAIVASNMQQNRPAAAASTQQQTSVTAAANIQQQRSAAASSMPKINSSIVAANTQQQKSATAASSLQQQTSAVAASKQQQNSVTAATNVQQLQSAAPLISIPLMFKAPAKIQQQESAAASSTQKINSSIVAANTQQHKSATAASSLQQQTSSVAASKQQQDSAPAATNMKELKSAAPIISVPLMFRAAAKSQQHKSAGAANMPRTSQVVNVQNQKKATAACATSNHPTEEEVVAPHHTGRKSAAIQSSRQAAAARRKTAKKLHHRALHKVPLMEDGVALEAFPVDPEAQRRWDGLDEQLGKLDKEICEMMLQCEVELADTSSTSQDDDEFFTYPLITRNGSWRELLGMHDLSVDSNYDMSQVDREALQDLEHSELRQLTEEDPIPSGEESAVPIVDTPQAPPSQSPPLIPMTTVSPLSHPTTPQTASSLFPANLNWDDFAAKVCSTLAKRNTEVSPNAQNNLNGQCQHPPVEKQQCRLSSYPHRQKSNLRRSCAPRREETGDTLKRSYHLREKKTAVNYTVDSGDEECDSGSDGFSDKSWTGDDDDDDDDDGGDDDADDEDGENVQDELEQLARPKPEQTRRSQRNVHWIVKPKGQRLRNSRGGVQAKRSTSADSRRNESCDTAAESSDSTSIIDSGCGPVEVSQPIRSPTPPPPEGATPQNSLPAWLLRSPSLDNIAPTVNVFTVPSSTSGSETGNGSSSDLLALANRDSIVRALPLILKCASAFSPPSPVAQRAQPSNQAPSLPSSAISSEVALGMPSLLSPQNLSGGATLGRSSSSTQPTYNLIVMSPPMINLYVNIQNNNSVGDKTTFQLPNTLTINGNRCDTQPIKPTPLPSVSDGEQRVAGPSSFLQVKASGQDAQMIPSPALSFSSPRSEGREHSNCGRLAYLASSQVSGLSQFSSTVPGSERLAPNNTSCPQFSSVKRSNLSETCPSPLLSSSRSGNGFQGDVTAKIVNHAVPNFHLGNPKEASLFSSSLCESEKRCLGNTTFQERNPSEGNDEVILREATLKRSSLIPASLSRSEARTAGDGAPELLNHSAQSSSPPLSRSDQSIASSLASQELTVTEPNECLIISSPSSSSLTPLIQTSLPNNNQLDHDEVVTAPLYNAPIDLESGIEHREQLRNPQTTPSSSHLSAIEQTFAGNTSPEPSNHLDAIDQNSANQYTPKPISCSRLSLSRKRLASNPPTLLQERKRNHLDKHHGPPHFNHLPSAVSVVLERLPTHVLAHFLKPARKPSDIGKPLPQDSHSSSSLTEVCPDRPSSFQHSKRTAGGYSLRKPQTQVKYTVGEDYDRDDACSTNGGSSLDPSPRSSAEESSESETEEYLPAGPEEEESSEPEEEEMSEPSDDERTGTSSRPFKSRAKGPAKRASSGQKQAMRTHQCPHCPYTSNNGSNMKKHVRIHTGERPYLCHACSKSFSDPSCLKAHQQLRHTSVPEFKCPKCEKAFFIKQSLREHLKTHAAVRPFSCMDCNKSFFTRAILQSHVKRHLPQENRKATFICKECDRAFFCKLTLGRHLKRHVHKCDKCDAVFIRHSQLLFHKMSHSVVQTCDKCLEEFKGDHFCSMYRDD